MDCNSATAAPPRAHAVFDIIVLLLNVNNVGVNVFKLTFIHNYRYPQFKLWISTIRIADINNSNC